MGEVRGRQTRPYPLGRHIRTRPLSRALSRLLLDLFTNLFFVDFPLTIKFSSLPGSTERTEGREDLKGREKTIDSKLGVYVKTMIGTPL